MNQKLIDFNKTLKRADIPTDIKTGDVIRVHKKIKEGEKERVQIFKGLVIAIKGKQSSSPTITVRRDSQGVGVEMILPIFLPAIEKIEILRHSKIRREKLYYMRERAGKSAKMKIKDFSEKEKNVQKEEKNRLKEIKDQLTEKNNQPKVTEKTEEKEVK